MRNLGSLFQSTGWKVLVFVLGTVLLGAILAPMLFFAGKLVVEVGWLIDIPILDRLHGSMERARFSRYFNRAILGGALIMLFPTLKWLSAGASQGVRLGWWDRLQIQSNPAWRSHLFVGFLLAAVPLLLLGWFYVHQGWYEVQEARNSLFSVMFSALTTGLVVALLEEFVFRGALTSIFSGLLKPWPLLISVAAFFALTHFLKPPVDAEITQVTMGSGFHMLGLIFSQFGDFYFLAAEFAVLFAIGWVLGYTRLKTNSLWLGIGLHTGWVFGVKTLGPITKRAFDPAAMMPWLGGNLRVGLASCLVVCLTGLVLWLWLNRKSEKNSA